MADLRLSTEELQPLVKEVLKVVLAEQNQVQQLLNGKMAFREEQAAELLGLNPWQLRDLRLAGKIGFHRIVGNRIRYSTDDLKAYLEKTHQPGRE